MVEGIKDNFSETFNLDNLERFVDKETSYFDKVEYAKEATKTATTIYGSYKTGQGIYQVGKNLYNKLTSPTSLGTMNKIDAVNYKNYWKQVKQGLTAEQRYNFQKYGSKMTFADYMTIDEAANYNQYWEQIKQGLTAEQRYNYKLYENINGSTAFTVNETRNHHIDKYGDPNTITRKIDDNGVIRDRIYGANGKAVRDIDFIHGGKYHIFPHMHQFVWKKGGVSERINIK